MYGNSKNFLPLHPEVNQDSLSHANQINKMRSKTRDTTNCQ